MSALSKKHLVARETSKVPARLLHEVLSVRDQRVCAVSLAMRWKPTTALRRINAALPTYAEKTIYLAIGASFGLRPESFAKIFKAYMGDRKLRAEQLEPPSSEFSSFLEFLSAVLDLLKVQATDYPGLSLSIKNATEIVLTYGHENYELFFQMLESHLPQLRALSGLSENADYSTAMNRAAWWVLRFLIPKNRAAGRPDILSLDIETSSESAMTSSVNQPDPLEMDHDSLANTQIGRDLKKLGFDL